MTEKGTKKQFVQMQVYCVRFEKDDVIATSGFDGKPDLFDETEGGDFYE